MVKKNSIISSPKSVSISITGKCNLKCNYCFYSTEMDGLKDLSTVQWLTFFKQLGALSVMDVSLTGGEAFIRPDLYDLIDGIIENRMRYNILSNGTLIDEKAIEKLSFGKRKIRLDYIQISIDGSKAQIHNKSRPESFDRAVRGLKLLHNNNFPLVVRVTINKHNLNDLESVAQFLLEEIGISSFSTNEAMPIGSGCQYENEIALSSKEKLIAMKIINKLMEKYPGRLKAQAGPQAKLKMYDEMERIKHGEAIQASWLRGYLSSCGCVFSRIDILHDGTIVPCCMLAELKLGNILSDSLQDIWLRHPIMEKLRTRKKIPMTEVLGCSSCSWNSICNGGCPGLAFKLTGDINRANPEDCIKIFLEENALENFNHAQ